MLQHHADCIERLRHHFDDDPEVLAVILGGSVAKGTEKSTSDIDGVVVVSPERRERLRQTHQLAGVITGVCDYEGAMFDLKYVTVDWLRAAAERGSEPTRSSFLHARVIAIYEREHPDARKPELASAAVLQGVLDRIGRYPVEEKAERLHSFYAAYYLNKGYFWHESFKRPNPFLLARTASEIALYGLRMILAQNEVLFPCMKWLTRAVESCADRPENVVALAEAFVSSPTEETLAPFAAAVECYAPEGFAVWDPRLGGRYVEDFEQWWYSPRPYVAEW